MQKRILLSLLWGVIFSISLFSQNLKAEKITLPDSKLNNLYKIDSGVYRSERGAGRVSWLSLIHI